MKILHLRIIIDVFKKLIGINISEKYKSYSLMKIRFLINQSSHFELEFCNCGVKYDKEGNSHHHRDTKALFL